MECQRGLAMRKVSVCPSVCLSVCLSVERMHCHKTEKISVQLFITDERSFSLKNNFLRRRMLVGATPST